MSAGPTTAVKLKDVPGVQTLWRVQARGGRRTYTVTTYPGSSVIYIEDARRRKINAPKLEAEIRRLLNIPA